MASGGALSHAILTQCTISSVKAPARVKIQTDSSEEVKSMKNAENKAAMENMKYEIAIEYGLNLNKGYNGYLSSKDAGHIGGNMVKKMIEAQERAMSGNR